MDRHSNDQHTERTTFSAACVPNIEEEMFMFNDLGHAVPLDSTTARRRAAARNRRGVNRRALKRGRFRSLLLESLEDRYLLSGERLDVDIDATGAATGATWQDAFPTLEATLDRSPVFNGDADSVNDVSLIQIADGKYGPTVDVDQDGNLSEPVADRLQGTGAATALSLDASAATVTFDLQALSDSGVSDADNITNIAAPTFDVTVSEAGRITVDYQGDGTSDDELVVSAGGVFHFTAPELQDGSYSANASFAPVGGDAVQESVALTIDTHGPRVLPGILAVADSVFQRTLVFSEPVVATTVDTTALLLVGPGIGPGVSVTSVTGSGDTYDVQFEAQDAAGAYSLQVSPVVADAAGNQLDQDRDATNGEPIDDVGQDTFTVLHGARWLTLTHQIDEGSTEFDGEDVVVDGNTLTVTGAHTFNSLWVINGGQVTHAAGNVAGMQITTLEDVAVDRFSRFTSDGQGNTGVFQGAGNGTGGGSHTYSGSGGGGYGGVGGWGVGTPGGVAYGSPTEPVDLGSGGGASAYDGTGGAGGGAIRLIVGNTLTLDGTITANAYNGWGERAGGGSGGSIWVTTDHLSGVGSFHANGGAGTQYGGGGGGGRIAIYALHQKGFNAANVSADGGAGYSSGQLGTIHWGVLDPTSVEILLQAESDTGVSNSDLLTNDTTPTFDVTVYQGGTISIDFDDDGVSDVTQVVADHETYAFTSPVALSDGGNKVTATLTIPDGSASVSQTVVIDTTGPYLLAGPAEEQSPLYSRTLQFSEPIAGLAADGVVVTLTGPESSDIPVTPPAGTGAAFLLDFGPVVAPGEYVLAGNTAITDLAGNPVDQDRSGVGGEVGVDEPVDSFTVLADVTPPAVTSFTPQGLIKRAIDSVTIAFGEDIQPGSFTAADVLLEGPAGATLPAVQDVAPLAGSSREFEIHLASPLDFDGQFTVTVGPDIRDLVGNPLAAAYATTFSIQLPLPIPPTPGDGVLIELFNGIGGGQAPTPGQLDGRSPDGTTLSPVIDFPSPGNVINVGNSFSTFFAGTTTPPDEVAQLAARNFILRHRFYLAITDAMDLNPATPDIDVQLGVGSDDGFHLTVDDRFIGSTGDRPFQYSWYDVPFESAGLYPVNLLFAANAVGQSGLEFSWNTAISGGNRIIPQEALYVTPILGDRKITFEELPTGIVVSDQYRPEGILFDVLSGDLQITDSPRFIPVSSPNVFADAVDTPAAVGEVDLRFVVPGTDDAGTTNFFSLFLIDTEQTGATVTAFDPEGNVLYFEPVHSGGGSQTQVQIQRDRIARVRVTLGQGTDTAAIDNITFNTPTLLNSRPVIQPIDDVTVDEQTQLSLAVAVDDPDLPAQTLSYSLAAGAPQGATIHPTSGQFSWTPSESQGPDVYPVTVVVRDDGSPRLRAEETFQITVAEVNRPPVIDPIAQQTVTEFEPLQLQLVASDPDVPGQTLDFSLDPGSPAWVSVDAATGLLEAAVDGTIPDGPYPVTVRVTDDGAEPLSVSETFDLIVDNARPDLVADPDQIIAPRDIVPGQPFDLAWQIANMGSETAVGRWTERVYLANGPAGANRRLLAAFDRDESLAVGDPPLERVEQVVVPADSFASQVFFVVEVDPFDTIAELNEENSFVGSSASTVPAILTLSTSSTSVTEGGSSIELTATRNGDVSGDLTVMLTPSDPAQVTMPAEIVVPAGQNSKRFTVAATNDGIVDGDAVVTIAAAALDYAAASAIVTVIDTDRPALTVELAASELAEGASTTATVTRDAVATDDILVDVSATGANQLAVPLAVVIPAGQASTQFAVTAADDTLVETAATYGIRVSAPGHDGGSTTIDVPQNDVPALTIGLPAAALVEGSSGPTIFGSVTRDVATPRDLVVALAVSDPNELSLPATLTIPAGAVSADFLFQVSDDDLVNGTRTAGITARVVPTAGGASLDQGADMQNLDILDNDGPTLTVTVDRDLVAEGGQATVTVRRNTDTAGALVVDLASSDETELTVPATVEIPAGADRADVTITGQNDGQVDGDQPVSVTASSAGFNSGTAAIIVTDTDLPDLVISSLSGPTSGLTEETVDVGWSVLNDGFAPAEGTWTQRLFLSDDDRVGGDTLVGQFTFSGPLPVGASYERTAAVPLPRKPGDYWFILRADIAGVVHEGLETNNTAIVSAAIAVAPAYSATVSADIDTAPADTPVLLTGSAQRPDGTPAAFEQVSVHLRVRGTKRVFPAITDTDGNFSTTFTPLPREGGTYTVGAAHPGLDEAPVQDTFQLVGMRAEPPAATERVVEGETEGGAVTIRNLADVPLTELDVAVLDKPDNLTVAASLEGDVTELSGLGTVSLNYQVTANDPSVLHGTVHIQITSAEAPAVVVPVRVDVVPLRSKLVANPGSLAASMLVGDQTSVEFTVTNTGGKETGPLQILLPPGADWLSLATPATMDSLAPTESASVTLLLTPLSSLRLTDYPGDLFVRANDGQVIVPFRFRAVSEAKGDLEVTVVDEFFYYTEEKPLVDNATVILRDAINGGVVASSSDAAENGANATLAEGAVAASADEPTGPIVTIDPDGRVTFTGVPEGPYTLEVRAEDHESYHNTVHVAAGGPNAKQVFISRDLVEYVWTVEEVAIEDRTRIKIESVFETDVPAPVVTIDGQIDLADLTEVGQTMQVDFTIKNHGLIAAENVALEFGSHPFYEIVPLVGQIGVLPAKSELVVPVTVRRVADFDTLRTGVSATSMPAFGDGKAVAAVGTAATDQSVPCEITAILVWSYICGPNDVNRSTLIAIVNVEGNCATESGPLTGGGIGSGGGGEGPGGVTPVVVQSAATDCTGCTVKKREVSFKESGLVNEAIHTAAGFLKLAPVVKKVDFGVSGKASWEDCCEKGRKAGSKLVAGAEGEGKLEVNVPIAGGSIDVGQGIPLPLPPGTKIDAKLKAGLFFKGEVGLSVYGNVETQCDDWSWSKLTGAAGVKASGKLELQVAAGLGIDLTLPDDKHLFFQAFVDGGLRGSAEGKAEYRFNKENTNFNWEVVIGKIELFGEAKFTVSQEMAGLFGIEDGVELGFSVSTTVFDGFKWSKDDPDGSGRRRPGGVVARAVHADGAAGLTNPVTGEVLDTSIGQIIDLDKLPTDLGFADIDEMSAALGEETLDLGAIPAEDWPQLVDRIDEVVTPKSVDPGACAQVRIQVDQEAVQTRQGFEATLELSNGHDNSLQGIGVDIVITDSHGLDVTDAFAIEPPRLTGISAVDGFGVLASRTTGSAQWTIVPTTDAAKDGPMEYFVGGTLRYNEAGSVVRTPFVPASITVHPQPELDLKYFHQRDVISDDPFTDPIEPAEPFSLAVMVENHGAGAARNLRIESAQPKIIENEKGLLVDFEILGTKVNGHDAQRTLTANFGDVDPDGIAIAEWQLESSLQGLFVDYKATFEHLSGLGDERLSLIKNVEIHELIRTVDASQVGGDDGLPDFLVNDLQDPADLPDTLYLSDGSVAAVGVGSAVSVDAGPVLADMQVDVTANMTTGWSYLKMDYPQSADGNVYKLIRVERSDGTALPTENFWQTDRTFIGGGQRPILEDKIHLLDYDSTGAYTFVFSNGDLTGPEVVGFAGVQPNPTTETVDVVDVLFSERLRDETFDRDDLRLLKDGVEVPLGTDVVVTHVGDATYRLSGLAAVTADDAVYDLVIDAAGVTDQVGNTGVGRSTYTWVKGDAAPAVLDLVGPPSGLVTTGAESIDVVWTEPIDIGTLTTGDLSLTRDGQALLDDAVTIAQVGTSTYRIGNLGRLTATDGNYQFEVDAAGVEDLDGTSGIGMAAAEWTLDSTPPELLTVFPPATNPRNVVVQQIDIDFSEPIDLATLDVGDLTLTRDGGGDNLLEGDERVVFEHRFGSTYRIHGIDLVQAVLADPQVAQFTLVVDGSGTSDLAGNTGMGTASATWTIDLERPQPAANLVLATASGPVVDGLLDSRAAVLSGDLAEPGLAVAVRDATTGIELARETFAGASFSLPLVFPSVGQHALRVRTIDPAGNVADATIDDLFVDQAPPVVLDVPNVPEAITTGAPAHLDVVFNQAVDFDSGDVSLVRNHGSNLIDGNVTVQLVAGTTATYRIGGLADLTSSDGLYQLAIDLAGVRNALGNAGIGTTTRTWLRDTTAPTSRVDRLTIRQELHGVIVSVTGDDPASDATVPGSGVASYDVYVSENWQPFQLWRSLSGDQPTATFVAQSNSLYSFRSVARDAAGNEEGKPRAVEAWTYVPDVDAPTTQVDAVSIADASNATLRVKFSGIDAGGNGLDFFELFVEVDGGQPEPVGRFWTGKRGGGHRFGSAVYQAIADGQEHTYRFFTIGTDRGGNVEVEPNPPNDLVVSERFDPPATFELTDLEVQRGATQRSFIRRLDVTFNDAAGLAELVASMADGEAPNDRVRLRRFERDGSGLGETVDLAGRIRGVDHVMEFDFGAGGIGGQPNDSAGDGYYELSFDLDGDGSFETGRNFYRLLGDANGDRTVDRADLSVIGAGFGQRGANLDEDINGDGRVNVLDRLFAQRALGRHLEEALVVDD